MDLFNLPFKALFLLIVSLFAFEYSTNGQTTDISGQILRKGTLLPIEDTVHFKLLLRQDVTFYGVSDQSGHYFLSDIPTDETTDISNLNYYYNTPKTIVIREGDYTVFRVYGDGMPSVGYVISTNGHIISTLKGVNVDEYTEYKLHSGVITNDGMYIFSTGQSRSSVKFVKSGIRIFSENRQRADARLIYKTKNLTTSYIISVTKEGYEDLIDTISLEHNIINNITHLLLPELAANGSFRAVIRQDGVSYPPGKIVYRGLNVAYLDSILITSPPFIDVSGVPIPSADGYALVERTTKATTTPFVAKIDTVQINSNDNGVMYHDVVSVPPISQVEQIGGNIVMLLTGGQKADGVDVVWKELDGTLIDSVRTDVNGDYLFKQVPTQTQGYLRIKFPGTDPTRRDTAYYKIVGAPLSTIDYIVNEDDTIRTNHNIAMIPKWIVDPYTGQPVRTEIDDIEELEGGRINSELALYGEENVYLDFDSKADSTQFFNYRTLAIQVMGYDGHNYVATPRNITLQMQNDYKLRDASKKHLYGRNMSKDGISGDNTTPKSANDERFILNIGQIINFSGDLLGFFKEDIFRPEDYNAVDPANRVSVMNPTQPTSITIPTDKDRVYHTLFRKQRERQINGTAFYRLNFLEE